jgi:hypothetical protein
MKKYIKFFILLFLLSFLHDKIYSQFISESFKIENISFPKPTVTNLLTWVNMSFLEWEEQMKMFNLKKMSPEKGGVYYASGGKISGVYEILKYPGGSVAIRWTDFAKKGITVLDSLVDELEPYFNSRDVESGLNKYGFRHEGYLYVYAIIRDGSSEWVILQKTKLEE